MKAHLADGIWKGLLEKLPHEKDGRSGGDGISCKVNAISKTQG